MFILNEQPTEHDTQNAYPAGDLRISQTDERKAATQLQAGSCETNYILRLKTVTTRRDR